MRVGLIDVDGHNFPNLALMKLSAWHKAQGDSVTWYQPLFTTEPLDRIYMSKVFTFTPDYPYMINAEEIVMGGTGYKLYTDLPEQVDRVFPDYSIYPKYSFAIGFLTRGCIRKCPWCIVPRKEGFIRAAATWQQIKRPDSRDIVFMDNNVLACEHGVNQIADMAGKDIRIDFNQALDARLITPEIANLLARVKWIKYVRMACDTSAMLPVIERAVGYLLNAGIPKWRLWAYVLVQDVQESHDRIIALDKMGVEPFAQPYRDFDGGEPTKEQKRLARWCNNKSVFRTCQFRDYRGGVLIIIVFMIPRKNANIRGF